MIGLSAQSFLLKRWLFFGLFSLLAAVTLVRAEASDVKLSYEERAWIAAHQQQAFSVGFDPFAGMDFFEFRGARSGFLPDLLADMQKELGLRFSLAEVSSWDDAYKRFVEGKISLLYGANPTSEREKIMAFTRSALRNPYVVFARKDSFVQTLGDLDGRRVGFMSNDYVSQQMSKEYPAIHVQVVEFEAQRQGLNALVAGEVDGFIASGGGVELEFVFDYPLLTLVAELRSITSDMTFAVLNEQAVLAGIIDKYMVQRKANIQDIARSSRITYNRKVLRFTEKELDWLEKKGAAVVGVADDYLPFDWYQEGQYKGIGGETLKRISEIVGVRFEVVNGPFAELYERARSGSIDVLNIAKTDDRLAYFIYPRPISTERDIIVGLKTSAPVQDVYGLEGKRVAVIDGFWHEEYLRKNLKQVEIIKTVDIKESLQRLLDGEADYLIENPTVVEFYINGLGYAELVKRGNTSKDSFVYFGVNRQQPELAAVIDKALTLIRLDDVKYAGLQSVPKLRNEQSRKLVMIVVGLLVVLALILLVTMRVVFSLAKHKAQTQILKEREHLLYTDTLTGFHNRNYFSRVEGKLQQEGFPQAVLMVDLNHLKVLNDTYGHAAGDALLSLFGRLLRDSFPSGNIFRIGGDEFLVLLDRVVEEQLVQDIERLKKSCQESGQELIEGVSIVPSAAIGYVIRQSEQDALTDAISLADKRMYEVKVKMKKRRTDYA